MKAILIAALFLLVSVSAQASFERYAGTYSGQFNSVPGSLIIDVQNGVFSAKFVAANGSTDILGSCNAVIGRMLRKDIDDEVEIDTVTFELDRGACKKALEGKTLFIDFKHDDNSNILHVNAQILHYSDSNTDCTGSGEDRTCATDYDYYYYRGSFKK